MPVNSTSIDPERILFLLQEVKRISEEDRNPTWGNNPRRSQCGKICNSAAAASDLGSTGKNNILEDLRRLVKLGHLIEIVDKPYHNYAFFRLSSQGKSFIEAAAKNEQL